MREWLPASAERAVVIDESLEFVQQRIEIIEDDDRSRFQVIVQAGEDEQRRRIEVAIHVYNQLFLQPDFFQKAS